MYQNRKFNGTFGKTKRGKYNQKGRFVGTQWCDSKAEADRLEQLQELERRGDIDQLECQVPYPCRVNGHLVTTYVADFRYRINPGRLGQRTLVEDVKGMATQEYKIKRALVHALGLCEIIELQVPKHGSVINYRFLTADKFGIPAKGE